MIPIFILEDTDVILETDFVRQLSLEYVGQSDTLLEHNPYSGMPINYLPWLEVKRAGMPFFIGKTVGEYRKAMLGLEKQHQPVSNYEFARGNIPKSHILPETDKEKYKRIEHAVFSNGKYKGTRFTTVFHNDRRYYQWAASSGLVPYEIDRLICRFN